MCTPVFYVVLTRMHICYCCAALLAAYTYDMRSGAYAQLMTVQESPLGAAYRNLTSLSTTGPSSSTNKAPTAAAAAPAPAVVPAGSSASRGGTKAAAGRLQSGAGAAVAGQGEKKGNKAQALSNSLPAPEQAAAPVQPSGAPAAAEVQPPHEAAAVQQWPPAPCSTKSSPRMLGYAVPLQPIHPTATLAAAAEANSTAAPGSAGADVSGSSSSSTLQLYVSVLTRFPFLVRELAAEELWEQDHDALDLEAVERWAHTKSSARTAVRAAGAAEAAGSGSWAEGSRSESRDGPAVDACCVVSHPPCTLMGRPDVKSLGAYLGRTKLQQVRGAHTHGVHAGISAMQGLVQCDIVRRPGPHPAGALLGLQKTLGSITLHVALLMLGPSRVCLVLAHQPGKSGLEGVGDMSRLLADPLPG